VFNLLYGKEWMVGKQKNNISGFNVRAIFFGGKRYTPVNQEQSVLAEDVVYHYSKLYEGSESGKLHANASVYYRINKRSHAIIWSLQMMNVFLTEENYGYYYNYKSKQVEPWNLAVPAPNLSYRIEF
jgi:hypothetical protein